MLVCATLLNGKVRVHLAIDFDDALEIGEAFDACRIYSVKEEDFALARVTAELITGILGDDSYKHSMLYAHIKECGNLLYDSELVERLVINFE